MDFGIAQETPNHLKISHNYLMSNLQCIKIWSSPHLPPCSGNMRTAFCFLRFFAVNITSLVANQVKKHAVLAPLVAPTDSYGTTRFKTSTVLHAQPHGLSTLSFPLFSITFNSILFLSIIASLEKSQPTNVHLRFLYTNWNPKSSARQSYIHIWISILCNEGIITKFR